MPDDYSDIINLPHPTSRKHPRMSMAQRAAQFAPLLPSPVMETASTSQTDM